jgi:DNA uptake protein ComE-like DNA-binding protein
LGLAAVVAACALPPPQLDVNGASARELQQLPGIAQDDAERIVAARPYASKDDLLRRHVISAAQYDSVAGNLYVGPPGMPDYLRSVPPAAEGP